MNRTNADERGEMMLLLISTTVFAVSGIGLTSGLDTFSLNRNSSVFLIPMLLTSIHSSMRLFGLRTSEPIFGVSPQVLWPVIGLLIAARYYPPLLGLLVVSAVAWWFWRQFQSAEENAEAKAWKRKR